MRPPILSLPWPDTCTPSLPSKPNDFTSPIQMLPPAGSLSRLLHGLLFSLLLPQMLFPELWQTNFSPSHPSYLLFPLRFAVPNVFFRFSPPHCIGYWLHLTSVTNRTLVNRWKLLSRDTWESRNERFLRKPNIGLNTPRKPPLVLQLRQGPWGTVNTVRTDDHTEVGAPP